MALLAPVASTEWTRGERANVHALFMSEREEMAYVAFDNIAYLQASIQTILELEKDNIAQLLKTPRTIRGKSARKATKGDITTKHVIQPVFKKTQQQDNISGRRESARNVSPKVSGPEPAALPQPEDEGPVAVETAPELVPEEVLSPTSDVSSPEKVPVRKGSMTFASLPPREPLKQSIGVRTSVEPNRRNTTVEDSPGSDSDSGDSHIEILGKDDDDDWIGSPNKQFPDVQQEIPVAPQSPEVHQEHHKSPEHGYSEAPETDDESLDLRAPELIAHEERMKAYETPTPPRAAHTKSASTATMISPAKQAEQYTELAKSRSIPDMSATPRASEPEEMKSPSRSVTKTLSASKRKLQNIVASARSLFTTTAGTSAAAKTEALNTAPPRPVSPPVGPEDQDMPGMYPSVSRLEDKPLPTSPQVEKAAYTKLRTEGLKKAGQAVPQEQGRPTRATKPLNVGPPIRPSAVVNKTTKPIKVNTLASARVQINPAPVAVHNQSRESSAQPANSLKRKASVQSIGSSKTVPRSLLLAQKRKEEEEKKAQAEAERKRKLAERTNKKPELIKQKKQAEQDAINEKARRISAERIARLKAERDMPKKENIPPRPVTRMDDHDDDATPRNSPQQLQHHKQRESVQQVKTQPSVQSFYSLATVKQPKQKEPELPPIYASSMFKAPVRPSNLAFPPPPTTQHQKNYPQYQLPSQSQHQHQMQQYAHQKIPFAQTTITTTTQIPLQTPAPQNQNKGPLSRLVTIESNGPESSPADLPEIHTDSSSSSSPSNNNSGFRAPSWCTPGQIEAQLRAQETYRPDAIFGDIAPLDIAAVFPNAERVRKLRMRTSSAYWVSDGLTREEVERDVQARERLAMGGGWRMGIDGT